MASFFHGKKNEKTAAATGTEKAGGAAVIEILGEEGTYDSCTGTIRQYGF
jgi:hypothetical protein